MDAYHVFALRADWVNLALIFFGSICYWWHLAFHTICALLSQQFFPFILFCTSFALLGLASCCVLGELLIHDVFQVHVTRLVSFVLLTFTYLASTNSRSWSFIPANFSESKVWDFLFCGDDPTISDGSRKLPCVDVPKNSEVLKLNDAFYIASDTKRDLNGLFFSQIRWSLLY